MPRLVDLPGKAILSCAGIVLVAALLSRWRSSFAPFRPETITAALFLYLPLFHYWRRPAPAWICVGDLRRSAAVFAALLAAGATAFLLYASLPLPAGAAAPRAAAMPPAGEFLLRQALFAAIPEEVFFRGYIYDAFEENGWEPIVLTSALFAAGHLAIHASVYRGLTFFPALLFGWARRKTGNIYVPAALHLAFNGLPYLARG